MSLSPTPRRRAFAQDERKGLIVDLFQRRTDDPFGRAVLARGRFGRWAGRARMVVQRRRVSPRSGENEREVDMFFCGRQKGIPISPKVEAGVRLGWMAGTTLILTIIDY